MERVAFGKFDREPENRPDGHDDGLIEAIKLITKSTPHELTYQVSKYEISEGYLKRRVVKRVTELNLKITETIDT